MLRFSSRICSVTNPKKETQKGGSISAVHRGMATLKAISIRLKSVKNIQKITQSMKMVSAAKYARAERDLQRAKTLGVEIQRFHADLEIPEEKEEVPKKTLFVAMTSDRGLCGAVHSSVAKIIRTAMTELSENFRIICVGDKSRSLLQRLYGLNIMLVCNEVGRLPPTFLDASKIANHILESDFPYETIRIVFNRFRSVVSYVTEELILYNFEKILNSEKLFKYQDEEFRNEVDGETALCFFEFSMAALLFYTMKESACSEQSSRMTAMDNASKNASEMINQLTLTFNRTRQAVITRELIEIISGASAL